jgi:transposase
VLTLECFKRIVLTKPPTCKQRSMHLATPPSTCLGLDIAKAKLDACLLLGPQAHHAQFDNSATGLRGLRAWCQKHGADTPLTVLEATGRYSELAATTLHAAGHGVHLANPRRIKDHGRGLGRRHKTDRIDAALIAHFGVTRTLPAWQPPSPAQQGLRELLRRLSALETMRQAERNRLETASDPLVAKSLHRLVRALEKEIATLEQTLATHLRANPDLQAEIDRLCVIEGIGLRTARWLCAELPRHLPNARAAAAWLGITPRLRQSGTSLRTTAPLGAEGNRQLRKVLFMAAMVARRHNPRLKAFADRLAQNGKTKMSVLFAVLHKLLKISFVLLKSHAAYDPTHNAFTTTKN